MTRKRLITKYSSTIVIKLTRSDLEDLNLKLGDEVDIDVLNKRETDLK